MRFPLLFGVKNKGMHNFIMDFKSWRATAISTEFTWADVRSRGCTKYPAPPPPVSTSQISQFICDFGFILGDGTTTYSIIHIYKKTNKFDISRVVSVGNYPSPFLHLIETGYFVITEACEIPSHRARQLAGQ